MLRLVCEREIKTEQQWAAFSAVVPSLLLLVGVDCTLEMRQSGWAHFAGKGLQSEAEAILTEVSADGCRTHEER